jgi:Uma2 family endonuclease
LMAARRAPHAILGHARASRPAGEEHVENMAAAASRTWTIDEVHALPDDGNRYEVIDGELFVTPAPALTHQRAVVALGRLLGGFLDSEPGLAEVLVAPADVIFSPRRAVQPDVFVLPLVEGRRVQAFADIGRLLLAIEVLSPSTARADRVKKRALYRDEGVPEYWIVDLDARTIERSTPADARVEVFSESIEWRLPGGQGRASIALPAFFHTVLDD